MTTKNKGASPKTEFFDLLCQDLAVDAPFVEETLLSDVSHVLTHPSELVAFCKAQPAPLGRAAWRLFDSSSSHCMHLLTDPNISLKIRRHLTAQLKTFFAEVFDPLCQPVALAELEDPKHLNLPCSLFWDIAPLGPATAAEAEIAPNCADVMKFQLSLSNPACRESALLGIEQWVDSEPHLMAQVMSGYDVEHEPEDALRSLATSLRAITKSKS